MGDTGGIDSKDWEEDEDGGDRLRGRGSKGASGAGAPFSRDHLKWRFTSGQ